MDIPDELVASIARGDAVLFIGAGLAVGAGLPGWHALIAPLADRISLPEHLRGDLLKVAQHYEGQRGRQALISHIKERTDTSGKLPTKNYRRLLRLGIRTWVTTNFDDLAEQALRQAHLRFKTVVRDSDLPYASADQLTLIKLHGDSEQPDTIVITQQDYNTYFRRFPRVKDKLSSLLAEKTFLFLGYSIGDPDFNQIHAEISLDLQQHQRMAYAVLFDADPFTIADLRSRNILALNIPAGAQADRSEHLARFLDELIARADQLRRPAPAPPPAASPPSALPASPVSVDSARDEHHYDAESNAAQPAPPSHARSDLQQEPTMPEQQSNMRQAVILTALALEYQAVRAHVTNLREETHPQGTVYERGRFESGGRSWEVGLVEIGPGNPGAAAEAERAINHFNPSLVLFVGVAGGIKDVQIGDVVAATKVYEYESGKAATSFQTRADIGNSTYRMEQRARAEARKADWLRRLKPPIPDPAPRVVVGPIAAGEKVVASTRSSIWRLLRTSYSDALAVEMEGYGFLRAAQANQHVDALVVRGISDLIDGKGAADAGGSQELAARNASAFAFELLAKLEGSAAAAHPGRPAPAARPSPSAGDGRLDYERGLRVLEQYVPDDGGSDWKDFNLFKEQLTSNLAGERRYGPTEGTRAERARVIDQLNPLALRLAGLSFTDLCLGKILAR
jgi:nucleoside phosphorylase